MNRELIAATVAAMALLIAASRTSAADLPVAAAPPAYYPTTAVYNWGGAYIGANGGYGFGKSQWGSDPFNPSGLTSTGNFNVNGGLAGVTAGCQWPVGRLRARRRR